MFAPPSVLSFTSQDSKIVVPPVSSRADTLFVYLFPVILTVFKWSVPPETAIADCLLEEISVRLLVSLTFVVAVNLPFDKTIPALSFSVILTAYNIESCAVDS